MRPRPTSALAAVALFALTVIVPASAQAPTYNVSWIAGPPGDEATYTGTATMNVDAKGVVTGKLGLVDPVAVTAALAGTIAKDTWTFEFAYEIPDQMCTGTLKGSGKVSEGRKTIQGTAIVGGECAPEPFDSSFTFTLQEKK
jgi:hypothetical protein